jgi:N-acyl-D-aspartate/D-glutamate deacylase
VAKLDCVIRGGTVADGTGAPLREADVAIQGGRIAEVGKVAQSGAEEIDARGMLVTPGFVDIHTHYDGQATWDNRLSPSSWHGVTTAVTGNCGVGFAPCRREDHGTLIRLMEGVEDIPNAVLAEGLPWNWETFPEFLDSLEARHYDIDFAAQLPHAAVRVYVMGERGADREPATPKDIALMAQIAREAVEAGALGFSTSRTLNHRSSDGKPTPTLTAAEDELLGIALALRDARKGVLQFVSDFNDAQIEMGMLRRLVEQSGRPLSVSMAQAESQPNAWRKVLGYIDDAAAAGLPMRAQVAGRPVGLMFGLETTLNPFCTHASWKQIAGLPLAGKLAKLREPAFRAQILEEKAESHAHFLIHVLQNFEKMYVLGDPPDYEQPPERAVGAQARARGIPAHELALDVMLANEGRGMLYFPFLNYAQSSLDASLEMMKSANTILGLGDGGAHLGTICDSSFTTHMLTHWTRDRTRGERVPLETVVRWHAHDTAAAVGLCDRGLLKPGYKADLNVIDYGRLTLRPPRMSHDLPAGGRRLVQDAEGYRYAIVSGQVTYRDGQPTGALPGRLLRGAQAAP